jgi:hypothetical protein
MLHLTVCPERTCQLPAEVTDRFVLQSTDGPIEFVATYCIRQHMFTVPIERLPQPESVRSNVRS